MDIESTVIDKIKDKDGHILYMPLLSLLHEIKPEDALGYIKQVLKYDSHNYSDDQITEFANDTLKVYTGENDMISYCTSKRLDMDRLKDDLYTGLREMANFSYQNFLTSFGLKTEDYTDSTKFETQVASLFYFDYCISSKKLPDDIRRDFFDSLKMMIINGFPVLQKENNLEEILDYRYYDTYSPLPAKGNKDWIQTFHTLYESLLKETANTDILRKTVSLSKQNAIEQFPKKVSFIKRETQNLYRSTKLVNELLKGKSLSETMEEINKSDTSFS